MTQLTPRGQKIPNNHPDPKCTVKRPLKRHLDGPFNGTINKPINRPFNEPLNGPQRMHNKLKLDTGSKKLPS